MKKLYCKPEIQFESFALSVDIAAGCERIIDTYLGGECGLPLVGIPGLAVFTSNANGCTYKVEDDGSLFDGYCYHNPYDDKNMFNS